MPRAQQVMGPLPIEHAAELSFPIPANVSTTVLNAVSSLIAYLQASSTSTERIIRRFFVPWAAQ